MTQNISSMNSDEVGSLLKSLTGHDFTLSNEGPGNAQFTLKAQDIKSLDSICIEWCVKSNAGLLIISEPITQMGYFRIPDDLLLDDGVNREEAEQQLRGEYSYYIENVEQEAYATSEKYGVTIRMEKDSGPRLFIFLGNARTDDDTVNAISALENLLPQLVPIV